MGKEKQACKVAGEIPMKLCEFLRGEETKNPEKKGFCLEENVERRVDAKVLIFWPPTLTADLREVRRFE